jgi:hypothetical protein
MPPIRTFDFAWPLGDEVRNITCAVARRTYDQWMLIRTSPPLDEFDPYDWCYLTLPLPNGEDKLLSPDGNYIVALKNYSNAEGLLARLESKGVIKHTGHRVPQGFVTIEMVEILVPEGELIQRCSNCESWESVDSARFARCGKCKDKFYCSRDCQAADWKAGHKKYCREGLTEEQVAAQVNVEMAQHLQDSGFTTIKE